MARINVVVGVIGFILLLSSIFYFTKFVGVQQTAIELTGQKLPSFLCEPKYGSAKCEVITRERQFATHEADGGKVNEQVSGGSQTPPPNAWFSVSTIPSVASTINTDKKLLCNHRMDLCEVWAEVKKPLTVGRMLVWQIYNPDGTTSGNPGFIEVPTSGSFKSVTDTFKLKVGTEPIKLRTGQSVKVGYYKKKLIYSGFNAIKWEEPDPNLRMAISYNPLALDVFSPTGFRSDDIVGYGCNFKEAAEALQTELNPQFQDIVKSALNVEKAQVSSKECTSTECIPGKVINWIGGWSCLPAALRQKVTLDGKEYVCEQGLTAQLWETGTLQIGTLNVEVLNKRGSVKACCPGTSFPDKVCTDKFEWQAKTKDTKIPCISDAECTNGGSPYVIAGERVTERCVKSGCKEVSRVKVECDGITKLCGAGKTCSPLTNRCVGETRGDVVIGGGEEKEGLTNKQIFTYIIIGLMVVLAILLLTQPKPVKKAVEKITGGRFEL